METEETQSSKSNPQQKTIEQDESQVQISYIKTYAGEMIASAANGTEINDCVHSEDLN